MSLTSELPPYLEEGAYHQQHSASILIEKSQYEALRERAQPMLSHPTYYEGWRNVVLDKTTGVAVVVVEGAV
jgi:hypothetical protein